MPRDWKSYNEALVRRGEILLSLDFINNWDKELEEMNEGKEGNHINILTHSYHY